jgi:O-antigen biosynthesis protein
MPPLPDEPSIYPYSAQRTVPARGLIVFAPHPDDEILGCGGLLVQCLQVTVPVHVVVLTSGDQGGEAAVREAESVAAARTLVAGTGQAPALPEFWRLPDRGVRADEALVARMAAAVAASGADWVLAPSPYEVHPDHRSTSLAASQAFVRALGAEAAARLAYFEVGHPLFANLLVDITASLERKRAAIDCFTSQLAQQAYGEQLLALNRFRSYTLGPSVSHAEAYQVVTAAELAGGLQPLLRSDAARVGQRLGLA